MPQNHVIQCQPERLLKLTALLFLILGVAFPRLAQCDFSFYIPSDHVSWNDLHPERSTAVAPIIDLCGDWRYKAGRHQGNISIPSCYAGYEGIVTFSRQINIPADWQGKNVKLHLLGVLHRAAIRINGTL
ncbi:hypothetical protein KKA08_10915, partial [bacterium]|nr:hypothetical protein [bacterium]